ncbi:MAG: DNA repair protein RecN [Thermodesulfobacteriota bacterium]
MLSELTIKNFAIIDELTLSFSAGLNVLSGETGAGKSIIINAINLLQGRRTSTDIIRSDEEEAIVEALFDISDNNVILNKIDGLGIEKEENLVVKRVISHSGKNKVFINGGLATLGMLAGIGEDLIAISGQHESQLLLNPERHIDILDDFGSLHSLRERVGTLFKRLLKLSSELAELSHAADKRAERESLLDFQWNEIERANLRAGEDDDLKREKDILINSEKLLEYSNHAYNTIYGAKESVLENLKGAKNNIKDISRIDSSLVKLHDAMESSIIELEDIALYLRDYAQKIEFDPAKLEEVEQRLLEINKLKKKYGSTIGEIIQHKERIQRELGDISNSEDTIARLKNDLHDTEMEILKMAEDLSDKRRTAAEKLKDSIEKELWSVGMEKTVFEAGINNHRFNTRGSLYENIDIGDIRVTGKGIDNVEFLLSPNPGEPPKALSRIASGGELSRVILALKSILAQRGGVETLIFDEVDAGIGGKVADIVGQKLKSLSRFHQVICITHLPQIARFADTHYNINKGVKDGRAATSVMRLDKEERIGEIARMLAGAEITEAVKEHAREMIETVNIDSSLTGKKQR